MHELHGHMLHGVSNVEITGGTYADPAVKKITTDGRVYLWSNGAITVYRDDESWAIYPAHRVLRIVGKEQG